MSNVGNVVLSLCLFKKKKGRVSMSDVHLWFLIWAISFVCAAINSGCWCWWSGSVAVSYLHPSDHLHGLGRREGAGLRSGPNVLTKVPRSEGILAFQVLCASCKLTPPLPSLHFSRLCLRFRGWTRFSWGEGEDLPLSSALSSLRCIDLPLDWWCH